MAKRIDHHSIEKGVRLILKGLDVDLTDTNFLETPERVARFYAEMFGRVDTEYATFEEKNSDFVMMKKHRLWTMCPHHLLPVELFVSMAYIPNGEVLGLSKLIRILNDTNDGPLLQEALTAGVLANLRDAVPKIKGAGILVNGQHSCTKVRGVQSDAWFTTYKFSGEFLKDSEMQKRFFELVKL